MICDDRGKHGEIGLLVSAGYGAAPGSGGGRGMAIKAESLEPVVRDYRSAGGVTIRFKGRKSTRVTARSLRGDRTGSSQLDRGNI